MSPVARFVSRLPGPLRELPGTKLAAWASGTLVYLSAMAILLSLAADLWLQRRAEVPPTAVVSIPGSLDPAERKAAGQLVLATLRGFPGVGFASEVPEAQVRDLVMSWTLGEEPAPGLLPIMFDVSFNPGAAPDFHEMQARLETLVPGSVVEDSTPPAGRAVEVARMMRVGAVACALLALVGAITVVAATAGHALRQRRDSILLLRQMGATDRLLISWLEGAVLRRGLGGVVVGAVVAAGTLAVAPILTRLSGFPLAGEIASTILAWILLAVVPVTALLAGVMAARLVATRTLRKL